MNKEIDIFNLTLKQKDKTQAKGIERILILLLLFLKFVTPGVYVIKIGQKLKFEKNICTDLYVFAKLLTVAILLYSSVKPQLNSNIHITTIAFIAFYLALETIIDIGLKILCRQDYREPISYARPLILGIINYFELMVTFSIFYVTTNSIAYTSKSDVVLTKIDYLYFSFACGTTTGFGDIAANSDVGRVLVICQSIIFFLFVIFFIGYNLSKFSSRYEEKAV